MAAADTAFLLEEDGALKALLATPAITVTDNAQAARPVDVWYGQPDLELRNRTYPYISIELIDINEANERVVSGIPQLTYTPAGYLPAATGTVIETGNFPTPYDLDYQISAWSRHPRHDREMLLALLRDRLPLRHGRLYLPDTQRVVRLDMLGGPRVSDTADENGKRLFRKVFTARVSTELFPAGALAAAGLVQQVVIHSPTVPPDFTSIEVTIP